MESSAQKVANLKRRLETNSPDFDEAPLELRDLILLPPENEFASWLTDPTAPRLKMAEHSGGYVFDSTWYQTAESAAHQLRNLADKSASVAMPTNVHCSRCFARV